VSDTSTTTSDRHGPIRAVPVRHPWRWAVNAILIVLAAMLVHTLFSKVPAPNGQGSVWRFGWNVVGQYFTASTVLWGVVHTLELTVLAMILGIAGGLVVATLRLSPNRFMSSTAFLYTWFFRGTPVYVQLLFWYNIATLYPTVRLGVPFGPSFWTINSNSAITPFMAALLGLGLNEAAYMAEIIRGGILAVDPGQVEAASSLGMPRVLTLRRIVIPQAMRVIIPPTGNESISMLKTTSLAIAAQYSELTFVTTNIGATTYQVVQLLIVASIWYLIMTSILSVGQYFLERHYARGAVKEGDDRLSVLWTRMLLKRNVTVFGEADA
jgi:polar amino acid transport system permease protein